MASSQHLVSLEYLGHIGLFDAVAPRDALATLVREMYWVEFEVRVLVLVERHRLRIQIGTTLKLLHDISLNVKNDKFYFEITVFREVPRLLQ